MMWWPLILFAYLLGGIPFAYLIVKERTGKDVRSLGSGNVGATNVLHVLGKGPAITVLILDVSKGCLPVLLARLLGASSVILAAVAFAAVVGHVFPLYLGLRGGKGVATACGAFLPLAPQATLLSVVVFLLVVAWTRFVSLASVGAVASFPIWVLLCGRLGWLALPGRPLLLTGMATAALIALRHQSNLRRLLAGTEKRLNSNMEARSE